MLYTDRMMRVLVVLAFLAGWASATDLAAQRRAPPPSPGRRNGFWYGVGLAPAWARVSCSICKGRRAFGASAFAAMGGHSGPHLRIGAELGGWRHSDGGVTQSVASLGAVALWFPSTRRAWYLKGGVAYVTHWIDDGTDLITSTGLGPQFGIGIESPFGRRWTVAPFFNYAAGALLGGVKFNGADASDRATVTFVQIGVSLTHP